MQVLVGLGQAMLSLVCRAQLTLLTLSHRVPVLKLCTVPQGSTPSQELSSGLNNLYTH
jgi:hypothetical protein